MNSNQLEFFRYLTPLKRYLKNKYSFFNSAHHILDLFLHKFWLVYANRCRMGCNRDKLLLFFSPESWDNGQSRYENLIEIRGLLTVWHAFKLYQKNSKKVLKNRPAVTKGILLRRLNVEIVFTFHLVRNSCLQTDSFGVFWRVRGHLFICFYLGLSIFLIGKIMIWYSSHSNEQRSKLLHFLFQFYLIELSATGKLQVERGTEGE